MTIKVLKAYLEKRQEKKRMAKQYAFEKACVDYFNNCVPRVDEITELADDIPVGKKGIPLLAKFNKSSYPMQAVRACISFEYDYGHYEVVEYADKTWVTELCFPVKPIRYFVLDFLTESE